MKSECIQKSRVQKIKSVSLFKQRTLNSNKIHLRNINLEIT